MTGERDDMAAGISETFLCEVLGIAEPINVRTWTAVCNLCSAYIDLPMGFSVERIAEHCHQHVREYVAADPNVAAAWAAWCAGYENADLARELVESKS